MQRQGHVPTAEVLGRTCSFGDGAGRAWVSKTREEVRVEEETEDAHPQLFRVIPSLTRTPGFVSFEDAKNKGIFLRHANHIIRWHRRGYDDLFKKDSSYYPVRPALNGDATMFSFRSENYPDRYMAQVNGRLVQMKAGEVP